MHLFTPYTRKTGPFRPHCSLFRAKASTGPYAYHNPNPTNPTHTTPHKAPTPSGKNVFSMLAGRKLVRQRFFLLQVFPKQKPFRPHCRLLREKDHTGPYAYHQTHRHQNPRIPPRTKPMLHSGKKSASVFNMLLPHRRVYQRQTTV